MLQVAAYYTISAATRMKFKSLIRNSTITKWFSFYKKHILDFTAVFCGTALFYNSMLWFSGFDLSLNLNRWLKLALLWIFMFFDKYILWIIAWWNSKRNHTFLTSTRKGCGKEGGGLASWILPCLFCHVP